MTEENKKNKLGDLLGNKQKMTSLLLIGTLIIGISLFGSYPFKNDSQKMTTNPVEIVSTETEINRAEKELENRLETILSQIEGAGQVEVSIFIATGTRYEYAINVSANKRVIDEQDQGGGIRMTTEDNSADQFVLIRGNQTGQEQPVVIQEASPQIQGILIVADGAKNIKVKMQLLQAVQTALGLDVHRIQVLPRGGR